MNIYELVQSLILKIAINPLNGASSTDMRIVSMLGIGLGVATLPKTIFEFSTSNNPVGNILNKYKKSNAGVDVSNNPSK